MPRGYHEDFTGRRFGQLTVLRRADHNNAFGHLLWVCRCTCGRTVERPSAKLTRSANPYCGECLRKDLDITGKRFGRLLVVGLAKNRTQSKYRKQLWDCICDCGARVSVVKQSLVDGNTRSCGCLQKDVVTKLCISRTKHGLSNDRLWNIWKNMFSRCFNHKNTHYRYYGGRGISVCDSWANDFFAFREWALSNGYDTSLTIERKDVNGNYCPENCTWVTRKEQMRNTRRNHLYKGKPLSVWAESLDILPQTVYTRLRRGWSYEEALGLVPRPRGGKHA